ncbi:S-layer homology domain-containing protein [Sporomusa malonica]|uniref:Capsule assembly protein Wzi n=1 Tax=Sporomusa malonica TaxID=112901 RepID=A0A1W1YS50_9FIRM|nr:S-layer homology domain-containing protein [Sporomusa malonica]SMC38932.1 Capsule assembly protein Wzi [Sporomusa malonica]
MKRQTALALAAVFSLSVAGTALAAPANPFVDVPAKHWAYDSVNKLAQAGVISGYGDGTYKGDKTLTRYEIAVIVGKAMANSGKMDAETKKNLDALKAEFSAELNNLGVRVDNLEKNASKVKFTGEVRERYDYQEDVDNTSTTRLRLNMTAQIADEVTFHGRYQSASGWGTGATTSLTQAYIAGKVAGLDYSFGRQPIWLGQGLIADTSGNCDGLLLTGGKDVTVTAGAFKSTATAYVGGDVDLNFYAANVGAKLGDNLNLSVSYLKDKDSVAYKTTSAGLNYTGIKNITVSGEFGQNDSDVAKVFDGEKAKAWMGKIQYAAAKKDQVGSLGVWAGYRNADPGFDVGELTTLDSARQDASFGNLDNVKGLEFGVEYTVFKNGVFTVQYNDLELKEAAAGVDKDKKNFFAHLVYSF